MDNVAHLYKITNTKTGEYYVGKHRGVTQETRCGKMYWGSGTRIQNQVKKYGTENFKYEILCISNTDYIFELESKYVTKELLQEDELCLNIVTGGREPPSKKGTVISEETRQKLIGRTPWNKGGTFSEESKKKMSESALGRKHSEETKSKLSTIRKQMGCNLPPEERYRFGSSKEKNFFSKKTIFISPNGEIFEVIGEFRKFVKEHNLSIKMCQVYLNQGPIPPPIRTAHKTRVNSTGWEVQRK